MYSVKQLNYLIDEYNVERKTAGLPYIPHVTSNTSIQILKEVLKNTKWEIIDSQTDTTEKKDPVIFNVLKKMGFKILSPSDKRKNAIKLLPLITRILSEAERLS